MKFGVVIFPGSNCDKDMLHVLSNVMQADVKEIWHKETSLNGLTEDDCVILPGGFSYGDYLRTGAIARFSPIMNAVIEFTNAGGYAFGICNGFQILCEAGLLPGVLLQNKAQKFVCKNVHLRVENNSSLISSMLEKNQVLKVPVAHADGRYFAKPAVLDRLKANHQILFKYADELGNVNEAANFNGSVDNIAGICNQKRNVFGMMPHPERAAEEALGNIDGKGLFDSMLSKSLAL